MRPSELEINVGTCTMTCTLEEIGETLAALLAEMRAVIPMLRPDEREVLRFIMGHRSGTLTVGDVFPAFARDSENHKTLRRFRAAQFVRPAVSGRWDLDERIEVKPFAQLMWDRIGEEEIFNPTPQPTEPPNNEPMDLAETSVAWNDDDVIDYIGDPHESIG